MQYPLNQVMRFLKEKNAEIYTRLSKFAIYKFISIKTEIDTLNEGYLNYNIYYVFK